MNHVYIVEGRDAATQSVQFIVCANLDVAVQVAQALLQSISETYSDLMILKGRRFLEELTLEALPVGTRVWVALPPRHEIAIGRYEPMMTFTAPQQVDPALGLPDWLTK